MIRQNFMNFCYNNSSNHKQHVVVPRPINLPSLMKEAEMKQQNDSVKPTTKNEKNIIKPYPVIGMQMVAKLSEHVSSEIKKYDKYCESLKYILLEYFTEIGYDILDKLKWQSYLFVDFMKSNQQYEILLNLEKRLCVTLEQLEQINSKVNSKDDVKDNVTNTVTQ